MAEEGGRGVPENEYSIPGEYDASASNASSATSKMILGSAKLLRAQTKECRSMAIVRNVASVSRVCMCITITLPLHFKRGAANRGNGKALQV